MKKLTVLLLIGLLFISGCSSKTKEQPVANKTEPQETTTAETQPTEPVKEEDDYTIKLNEPIEFDGFIITIKEFKLSKNYDGKDALVIIYDWQNKDADTSAAFTNVLFKAFQNGIETSDVFMVDNVDLANSQRDVKSGATITDVQTAVGIDDLSLPLELELTELFAFGSVTYTLTIDNLSELPQ